MGKKPPLAKLIIIAITLLLILPAKSNSAPLTVSYFERPPYYFSNRDQAAGFLIDLSKKIFADAGLEVVFISLPPARIIKTIKENRSPLASIGWFKKPEREQFAKFSQPIYQNRPIVLLTSNKLKKKFLPHQELTQIFMDDSLIMGKIGSFSYGPFVDDLLLRLNPQGQIIAKQQANLIKLIAKGRISYMLVAPEEISTLIGSADLKPADFYTHSLSDVPDGNMRYLIFSRLVEDEVIDQINRSIEKFCSTLNQR